jgi:hypothetical protein
MSVVSAFADGCQRVLRAPTVLLGLWLTAVFVPSPVLVDLVDRHVALIDASAMDPIPAVLSLVWSNYTSVAHALVATFLLGGVMDRLARNRATASFGFFGACGMYFFRFLRLAALALPFYLLLFLIIYPLLPNAPAPREVWLVPLVLALHLIFDYAKVRMVVEDRRSAIGSVTAAVRFIRRNPVPALALALINATVAGSTWWLAAIFGIGVTTAVYVYLLARVLLRMRFAAAATTKERRMGDSALLPLRLLLLRLIQRLAIEHRAAASLRTAAARIERQLGGIVRAFPRKLIVVPEFFARLDVPDRIDEDATAFDHRLAIRIAAVIDEARVVAANSRIDHGARTCDE